ncbi:hypothetical protein SDRG_15339 [Saprolegnia diclina VS20]|uniref:EF-hand domain-containing protein n=1 Tax=Saprolegnia diclina (strain VS20) TaxID=1156394 RepID=T0R455_SAPDV|nr:hypothetical protein SDRG_15339 [Saprolegnia diclina VS20]EQC26828.1 hypothetical protein SDRG_15339 [Saprolegnia diclina VS20]|eukprot:XP_008619730.1 hypothetical protein SDRG_15339 [Saprolegnia diclina VS20]
MQRAASAARRFCSSKTTPPPEFPKQQLGVWFSATAKELQTRSLASTKDFRQWFFASDAKWWIGGATIVGFTFGARERKHWHHHRHYYDNFDSYWTKSSGDTRFFGWDRSHYVPTDAVKTNPMTWPPSAYAVSESTSKAAMGGAVSTVVTQELGKPRDVSDIPDGDWKAAKDEVARLRQLLANLQGDAGPPAHVHTKAAPEPAMDPKSSDESREGRALWSSSVASRDPVSGALVGQIRTKLFERYDSLRACFLKIDIDRSGYLSRDEFMFCMANLGLPMTDEDFDVVQASYPHKEAAGDHDRGIGYLEFIKLMTDELHYTPGSGEDEADGNYFGQTTHGTSFPPMRELESPSMHHRLSRPELRPHTVAVAAPALARLRHTFNRQIFGTFNNMKDAFKAADKDRSGFVEPNELIALLHDVLGIQASDRDILDMLDAFDTNRDGKLAYSEFVKCLSQMR